MSDTYTKLFASITASTIVSEPLATRWLWVTFLALADASGNVYGSIPGVARIANITIPECESALACFLAPDHYSRTQDNEGRRVELIDGGWRLLNFAKYAAIRSAEERAEYKREWDRTNRPSGYGRQSDKSPTESECSPTKNDSPAPLTPTLSLEKKDQEIGQQPSALPDWLPPDVWDDWHKFRNTRKGWTHKAKQLSLRSLSKLRDQGFDPRAVIEQSIERGWTGLFQVHTDANHTRGSPPPMSATMRSIQLLETVKGNAGLDHNGTGNGSAKAALPEPRRAAFSSNDPRHRSGVA